MKLPYKLEEFTPEAWQKIFGAYVKANRSHWTGAPHDVVKKILETKGKYEFGFESMGTWGSKFQLKVREDGFLDASFIKNPDLSGRMKQHLGEMEEIFKKELPKDASEPFSVP